MNALPNLLQRYRRSRGAQRELATFGLCLLAGGLLMPVAIYLLGFRLLGDYTHGGFFSFLGDFWLQLVTVQPAFWCVALGPYFALWFWRLLRRLPHR
jgi:hypothetical protein